ncbi:hypothetical protein [Stenoxybacter acetivorans]|uniref:hypothetical protein n=1 Tax=Stenoxybacter acetivorans TaxID=422441 RepID=UPI00055BEF0C|nr:hypothetical protein [Stenoxybacter acetivorans]
MLNKTFIALLVSAVLLQTACSKQETSVTLSASEAAAAAEAEANLSGNTNAVQTLSSNDGAMSITVPGKFTDSFNQAQQWLELKEGDTLILFQRDDDADVNLSAIHFTDAHKDTAADYFKRVIEALKNQTTIQNLEIQEASNNRLNYRFSHERDGVRLNESCAVLAAAEAQYYAVCAAGSLLSADELTHYLDNITIK